MSFENLNSFPDSTVLFDGITHPERATLALKNAKRSSRGNPCDIRKTFLYEIYKDIAPQRALFVIQNNNLTASEYQSLKREFRAADFSVTCIQNSVFGAALEVVEPQSAIFRQLLVGPTILVFSNASDTEKPLLLKDFVKAAQKFKHKTLVAGAKLDKIVLSAQMLEKVVAMPNISQLRSQLVGLLQMPGQRLVGTLQQSPMILTRLLAQHEEALRQESEEK